MSRKFLRLITIGILGALILILMLVLGILTKSKPILETWTHDSDLITLNKTDQTLTVDRLTADYINGKNLDGDRAQMIFEDGHCRYELIINENRSAVFRTILETGAVCPYFDWHLNPKVNP